MDINAYRSLPLLMRTALSSVFYAQNIKWSVPIAWASLIFAMGLCSFGALYLLSDDIQFRRASFSSQELREWEAYATLVGKASLAELVADEKKSKDAGLPDAWVHRTFLDDLAAPATHSAPPSPAEALAAAALFPRISSLMAEKENLRIKIHKSLTSWVTCKKPASIFGPEPLSASSTSLETGCHAVTNYRHWTMFSMVFLAALAVFAVGLNAFARALAGSSNFFPKILQFRLKQRRDGWLAASGDQVFSRLESLFIALSLPHWPGRRPHAKPRRL